MVAGGGDGQENVAVFVGPGREEVVQLRNGVAVAQLNERWVVSP